MLQPICSALHLFLGWHCSPLCEKTLFLFSDYLSSQNRWLLQVITAYWLPFLLGALFGGALATSIGIIVHGLKVRKMRQAVSTLVLGVVRMRSCNQSLAASLGTAELFAVWLSFEVLVNGRIVSCLQFSAPSVEMYTPRSRSSQAARTAENGNALPFPAMIRMSFLSCDSYFAMLMDARLHNPVDLRFQVAG